jgi:type I restriction enzyme M protein
MSIWQSIKENKMEHTDFSIKAKQLIDDLKGICASAGLGGDANEYKIVTQSFLYKFLNDKFLHEVSKLDSNLTSYDDLKALSYDKYELLMIKLGTKTAHLKPEHLLEHLFKSQNNDDFAKLFDNTLNDIAVDNSDVFSVHTAGNTEIRLFEEELIADAVNDRSQHDITARKIINKLANSRFELDEILTAGFDFFSTLFEYMIKDYNKDGGGKYAEYYTPHSIAKIMAEILVGDDEPSNVSAYDPAAGSGTLLMNIAHKIGQEKCTIYSQDMSQKSSNLLRLNLILNGLSHSIDHIVQGNTMTEPRHITKKFDYIVSNPPFKLDFSDDHDTISSLPNVNERFFAGLPKVSKQSKDKMAIYLLFIQHIMFSLSDTGRAAIVVPTGFNTAQNGIEKTIREKLIDKKWLKGVVSMPSNIFATTGTNVSVIFIDKSNNGKVVLVDASRLGKKVKDGKNQKTLLSKDDERKIVGAFNSNESIEDFSVILDYEEIASKNYSFSAGQYFDIKIEYSDITLSEFKQKLDAHRAKLSELRNSNKKIEEDILSAFEKLSYEEYE